MPFDENSKGKEAEVHFVAKRKIERLNIRKKNVLVAIDVINEKRFGENDQCISGGILSREFLRATKTFFPLGENLHLGKMMMLMALFLSLFGPLLLPIVQLTISL